MKKNILNISLVATVFCSVFSACKSDDKRSDQDLNYYKQKQLKNIVDNGVNSQLARVKIKLEELLIKSQMFNTDQSILKLQSLKSTFKEAMIEWKACEIYEMGEIRYSYLYSSINAWSVNESMLENKLNTAAVIDESFVKKLPSVIRSMAAVEYLLYDSDEQNILSKFNNQELRGDYLVEVSKYLIVKIKHIQEEWNQYAEVFIVPNDVNKLNDGQNIVVNAIVEQLKSIKKLKLEIPLGTGNVKRLEAYRSGLSLAIIKANINQISKVYNGDFENSDNYGFDDFLSSQKMDYLNDKINELLKEINNRIDVLDPLNESLLSQTDKVNSLKQSVVDLIYYIKKDLKNATGIVISISNTDGD